MCAKNHLLIFSSFLDIWENVEWPRFFGPPCVKKCHARRGVEILCIRNNDKTFTNYSYDENNCDITNMHQTCCKENQNRDSQKRTAWWVITGTLWTNNKASRCCCNNYKMRSVTSVYETKQES